MDPFDQQPFSLRCEWGSQGITHLAVADVTVIVDVLSFSTAVDVALGQGTTVFPYRWRDAAAVEYAEDRSAILASPRTVGGGYSLSPSSLLTALPGLRLVLPSPNGSSLAFEAMQKGSTVVTACLRNASAVATWVQRSATQIAIVPAGERWPDGTLRPAVEDLIGAGAILSKLRGNFSPEAHAAVAAFHAARSTLRATLITCASGRELVDGGFERDVELARDFDVSNVVPLLVGEAFVPAWTPPCAHEALDPGGDP